MQLRLCHLATALRVNAGLHAFDKMHQHASIVGLAKLETRLRIPLRRSLLDCFTLSRCHEFDPLPNTSYNWHQMAITQHGLFFFLPEATSCENLTLPFFNSLQNRALVQHSHTFILTEILLRNLCVYMCA